MEVDKGLELPTKRARNKYPWGQMEVGDSFFMPNAKGGTVSGLIATQNAKGRARFSMRRRDPGDEKSGAVGYRVWRVA